MASTHGFTATGLVLLVRDAAGGVCVAAAMACGSWHYSSAHHPLMEWQLGRAGGIAVVILEGARPCADCAQTLLQCSESLLFALFPRGGAVTIPYSWRALVGGRAGDFLETPPHMRGVVTPPPRGEEHLLG